MKLMNEMNLKLDEAIQGNIARDVKISQLIVDVGDLKTGVAHRDGEIEDLRRENLQLKAAIIQNQTDVDARFSELNSKILACSRESTKASLNNERHSRSFNLRAFNIPEEPNEKTDKTIKLINDTIKRITGADIKIEYGHRTGKKRVPADGANQGVAQPRGVIFRFMSRQDRWTVFSKRRDFFRANIPLYEDLPEKDLEEKKKHAEAIQTLYDDHHKVAFIRGRWYVDGQEFRG